MHSEYIENTNGDGTMYNLTTQEPLLLMFGFLTSQIYVLHLSYI